MERSYVKKPRAVCKGQRRRRITNPGCICQEGRISKGAGGWFVIALKQEKELFTALYTWMFDEDFSFSKVLLKQEAERGAIEQTMTYVYGIFGANRANSLSHSTFTPYSWKVRMKVAAKSDLYRQALTEIIRQALSRE